MANNLSIDLLPRKDSDGRTFYVGKVEAPILIDCHDGATFLIFVSDKGEEQMQIALMDKKTAKSCCITKADITERFEIYSGKLLDKLHSKASSLANSSPDLNDKETLLSIVRSWIVIEGG